MKKLIIGAIALIISVPALADNSYYVNQALSEIRTAREALNRAENALYNINTQRKIICTMRPRGGATYSGEGNTESEARIAAKIDCQTNSNYNDLFCRDWSKNPDVTLCR